MPVVVEVASPVLDFVPNLHGSRSGVGESADDLFQLNIADNVPGVALSNIVGRVETIVLGDLGTSLDELFMRSLGVLKVEGRGDGESSDKLHKIKCIIILRVGALINKLNVHL